jgi:DNA adenine methylase
MSTRLTPPLKTHGGKAAHHGKLARRIVELMPPHLQYVEPFAGGLAVLLAKDPEDVAEVVNDLNGDLTNFWRVLQDVAAFERFYRIVEAVPFSETEWTEAVACLAVKTDPVPRAVAFFIACRQSLAGRLKGFATLTPTRTRRGMNEQVSAWQTAVAGLPTVHRRLLRVAVRHGDALDVICQQDNAATVFYCDPPYPHQTRTSTDAYGAFEMTEDDHRRLLALLRTVQGKVILSDYPSPLYDGLLADWNHHDFDVPNHASGGKSKRRMTERLWCNF